MRLEPERVLVLAPHTDDEIGCSGTVVRMLEGECEVYCAAFSSCEESVPEGFDSDVLRREFASATETLGVPSQNALLFDFRVRRFSEVRQDLLEQLVKLRQELRPDLVFLPARSDLHQDHAVVCQEGIRAFKHASILGYEAPQNSIAFQNTGYARLEERHIERKILGIQSYESQAFRDYMSPDVIRSWARIRGLQVGARYAEAFEVIRLTW